jgi:hypothetical protein
VDLNSQHVAADFFRPVAQMYPDIEEVYLQTIKSPMDLNTLAHYLEASSLIDEEDFYEKALSIFQNAVDFNAMQGVYCRYMIYMKICICIYVYVSILIHLHAYENIHT